MKFQSTRDPSEAKFSAAEVIKQGLAADGGLFVPEAIPEAEPVVEEVIPEVIPVDDADDDIPLFCENCGSKLEEDAIFCTECGYRVR